MEKFISFIENLYPAGFDLFAMLQIIAYVVATAVLIGAISHLVNGKGSGLAHAMSSSIAILFVYTFAALLYQFDQEAISFIIERLPLVTFDGETLHLFRFAGTPYGEICAEFLHVLILSILVIILDDLIPDAKNTLSWYILQFVIAAFATVIYCFVIHCLDTYVPGLLVSHAPMILISILLFMLFLGVLKVILGLMLTAVNPLFGALYTFFFASKTGKSISKATLCALSLTGVVFYIQTLGYTTLTIVGTSLLGFLPLLILLLALWFLLGYVL